MASKYIRHGETYNGDGTSSVASTGASISGITVATPAVITSTAHGLSNDDQIFLNGTVPTGLNTTTRYYVRNKTNDTFEVSLTAGGASIATTAGSTSGASWNKAVAAWNTITYFTGTAVATGRGAISNGDVVFIRSKDNAGADITVTATGATTLGKTATDASPIRWILDGGTVWSGINGTLTINSSTYTHTIASYNELACEVQDKLVIYGSNNAANGQTLVAGSNYLLTNLLLDTSIDSSSSGYVSVYSGNVYCQNVHFKSYDRATTGIVRGNGFSNVFVDCDFELLNNTSTNSLFVIDASATKLLLQGGGIRGVGASASVTNPINWGGSNVEIINFDFPSDWPVTNTLLTNTGWIKGVGVGGIAGGILVSEGAFCDSRNDGNYPTLNATLPDTGNTAWSWKINPTGTTLQYQINLPIVKFYTSTAAAKTVTLEILVRTSWAGSRSPTKTNLWMSVSYEDDSTGLIQLQTTRTFDDATLTTSTASWSTTTWGAVAVTKYKLSLTTSTSIKQNSLMNISLRGYPLASGSSDVIFVCPDVQLT